jgi:beta-mannanase
LVEAYVHWGAGAGTFAETRNEITSTIQHGATPVVTWMSDNPDGSSPAGVDLRSVAAGAADAYARTWADGLRSVRAPVFLRFDSEMNGNWMSYSPGFAGNGNTASDFVAAWRHLHDLFRAEGASNVSWVWSPNVEYPGSAPLRPLYPGDAYVDWVALDGYNWGTTHGHIWQSFSQVFDASIRAVEAATSRPLMIAETGSTEVGGDKAAWIADMFRQLAARHDVNGFIWFDLNKETDWRIASSRASAAAFAHGLAGFVTP